MFNIAFNTFKELTRNKILYMILFFGVILIVFSLALASLSLGQTEKIIVDFGLASLEIFGLISVIFVWSQILFREVEWKTIYLILSKPISRYEFILGKFLWFASILFFVVFFQSLILFALVIYSKTAFSLVLVYSVIFIYLKLLVLFSIILFLSSFMSSILSIILTVLIYIISHSITALIDMAISKKNIILAYISRFLYIVFPNFEALNIKNMMWLPEKIWFAYVAGNWAYAILYLCLILFFTIAIFNRKTFEN